MHPVTEAGSESNPFRPWALAWLGAAVLGVVNGTLREVIFRKRLSDRTASQVSAGTLILLLMLYMRGLQRRWPIVSHRAAVQIGGTWTFLTVLFEFGFGHFIARKSWETLLEDYDVTKGRLWSLVLLSMAAGPLLTSPMLADSDQSHERRQGLG